MYKYIVEFKFAIGLKEEMPIEKALDLAAQSCHNIYGFKPSVWFAEISKIDENGDVEDKYFYNPNSATFNKMK